MKSFITLLFVILSAVLLVWVARPLWDQLNVMRQDLSKINEALRQLNNVDELQKNLISARNSIPEDSLKKLSALLPEKPDSGSLLVTFEKITRDRGIRLRSIEFGETKSRVAPRTIPGVAAQTAGTTTANTLGYTFTVSASYEAFRSLLAALEKNARLIDVQEISFGGGGDKNLFEFNIRAQSYYQK